MEIDELHKKLDDEKLVYHQSSDRIKQIECEIAETICPHKVGDRIQFMCHYKKGDVIIEGEVEAIMPEYKNPAECFIPQTGKYPLWTLIGHRIKADGSLSKHQFNVGPVYYYQDKDGIFIRKSFDDYMTSI